ncbi:MAG TPA: hypothetical protein DD670_17530 [Planctomycetaceae bacterium]|nr:hypothetical protein [Planctomycetaceae bacterium]
MTADLRVVVDTKVIVSAMLLPLSVPRRALDRALREGRLLVPAATTAELAEVIHLPRFDKYLSEEGSRTAVRLAIAGNVMDLGVKGGLNESEIRVSIEQSLDEPLDGDTIAFAAAVRESQNILYLTDNLGEIVFDRLLIERMPREKTTVAVRGAPVINDATLEDAKAAGLTDLVYVIDNGSDAPGTILHDCSDYFQRRFADADLIIAKVQGNYETLRESSKQVYFLLRVKCPVIARDVGCPVGRMVLQPSRTQMVEGAEGVHS